MMHGFVILDKPPGLTSRRAGWRVARMFGAKTFGHVGTLDPMASGLLVVALGEATKMIPYLPDGEKEYLFSIEWGIETDTGDITGTVIGRGGGGPARCEIDAALSKLIGEYDQAPPAYSAKKIGGVAAYKLARKGTPVEPRPARVRICDLEIRDSNPDIDKIVYRVRCGPGTYVRSLVQDIAKRIPNSELRFATCSMIRRTKSNGFDIKDSAELDFLEKIYNNGGRAADYLKPLDLGLDDIPVAGLETSEAELFRRGGFVLKPGIADLKSGGPVRVYESRIPNCESRLIGMGVAEDGLLKPKRIINVD